MHFEPAASLTEKIADHLGSEIISGRLRPKARIQELKVASELGVSRGSVREALLILERRYLVEILPRRGAMVSSLESEELANCSELVRPRSTVSSPAVATSIWSRFTPPSAT
jgi:DNA-binding GntR family transcriptional regulator